MKRKKIFIAIGIFWIVIIGAFIAFKEFTLRTGKEILLKTRPVDPRDLFRGDYVILRYDISSIDLKLFKQAKQFQKGDVIYASLDMDNSDVATLAGIDKEKPAAGLFMKGTITAAIQNSLSVEYGIESYFVPEGKGEVIEQNLSRIYAKLAVDSFGTAVIKALVLDGKEINLK